jgi:hypothetical protein
MGPIAAKPFDSSSVRLTYITLIIVDTISKTCQVYYSDYFRKRGVAREVMLK